MCIRDRDYVVDIENLTIRFNLASEKINDLKEYFIKLIRRELMFQEFLALQDINLKVKRGESWGLIGVNGSGKSTLLKSTCGILKPYKGSIRINGSIAPLIELGAGFDYNMTARENIFLNGTVQMCIRDRDEIIRQIEAMKDEYVQAGTVAKKLVYEKGALHIA